MAEIQAKFVIFSGESKVIFNSGLYSASGEVFFRKKLAPELQTALQRPYRGCKTSNSPKSTLITIEK
jgi:hypothetical protein